MAVTYKYIERPKDADIGIQYMQDSIFPLLQEHWKRDGQKFYDAEFVFNVQAFVQLWLSGSLTIVIAYDDSKAVGIFIGIKFIPMSFNRTILQVEHCFSNDADVEQGLYDYVSSIASILDFEELWVPTDQNRQPKTPWPRLAQENSIVRYKRK